MFLGDQGNSWMDAEILTISNQKGYTDLRARGMYISAGIPYISVEMVPDKGHCESWVTYFKRQRKRLDRT